MGPAHLQVVVLPELLELLRPVGLDGVERLLDLLGLGRQPVLAAAAAQAATIPETGVWENFMGVPG